MPFDIGPFLERFGLPMTMLALFFWATFIKRQIVSRDELDRETKRADRMEGRADTAMELVRKTTTATEELIRIAEEIRRDAARIRT